MIADFIVDFSYLARAIKDSVSNCCSWACEDARRLLDIICCENGRLMIPVRDGRAVADFWEPLSVISRELSSSFSGASARALEVVDSWRDALVNNPVKKTGLMRRDIEILDGLTPMASLLISRPQAHAFITDSKECRIDGQKTYAKKTLKSYFAPDSIYEKRRLSFMGKQTVIKSNGTDTDSLGVICEQRDTNRGVEKDFTCQVESFAIAERNGFQIIDRYAMGGRFNNRCTLADLVNRRMRILLRWVDALTKGCPQSGKKVDVYTIFPGTSYDEGRTISYELKENDKNSLCEQLKVSYESWSDRGSNDRPHLRFFFLRPDVEDLHDRFICSSTHYFAIGKGLDGIEFGSFKCKSFNVYYCGRRTCNDIDIDVILGCGRKEDERLLCMYEL